MMDAKTTPAMKPESAEAITLPNLNLNVLSSREIKSLVGLSI